MSRHSFTLSELCLTCKVLGLFLLVSCNTENAPNSEKTSSDVSYLSRSVTEFVIPNDFFLTKDSTLTQIITTLKGIESRHPFKKSLQERYGIPLWDYSLLLTEEDSCYLIPLYKETDSLKINSLWSFHIHKGEMTYAPFSRSNPSEIINTEKHFIFNLLSYLIFRENNALGLTFINQNEIQTRTWVTISQCWDVYTGTESTGLEYSYTNCIDKSYWIDETNEQTLLPEEGGGNNIPIGGGSGSTTTNESKAKAIFDGPSMDDVLWNKVENLIVEMNEDCLGEALYNGIKELLSNQSKLTLRIIDNNDSNYHYDSNMLYLNVEYLNSEVLLHELMHAYQFKTNPNYFKKSLMNQEIEAHYAHCTYLKRKKPKEYTKFISYRRGKAINEINNYINENGTYKTGRSQYEFELFILNKTIPIFNSSPSYKGFSIDYDNLTFNNIPNLTKNCG